MNKKWLACFFMGIWIACCLAAGTWADPQHFSFLGKPMRLGVDIGPAGSRIYLEADGETVGLGEGIPGDNICPAYHISGGQLVISWVNYRNRLPTIALWSWLDRSRREFPLPGFSFASAPQLIFDGENPAGMVFLGNQAGNDDLFVLGLPGGTLQNLTQTAYSEKQFRVERKGGCWQVETSSLWHTARFLLQKVGESLSASPAGHGFITDLVSPRASAGCDAVNTYIAFGDSITNGDMRMDIFGSNEEHPDLAYPAVLEEKLLPTYGTATPVVEAVGGDTSGDGVRRIKTALHRTAAGYFLLLLGTNDCITNGLSMDSALENLEYIINQALAAGLDVIISTVPPRNDRFQFFSWVQNNLDDINGGIRDMVEQKKADQYHVSLADTYYYFMNYEPPDGWKDLLEDRGVDPNIDPGGQHPSPLGHEVMAGLFYTQFLAFPPRGVSEFTMAASSRPSERVVSWPANCESDFDHYLVEFGYSSGRLDWQAEVPVSAFTFPVPPFLSTVYFKITSVDKFGNRSAVSPLFQAGD